ncbi:MAG: TlyA family RNA methyltransferase [Deltaproteobacteria bacterium]|nr:TlyA family RNA methyltransferase [Deltaproteobacteria bacterium]
MVSAKEKGRIDRLLVERRLVESPEKALAIIMAGRVLVHGNVIDKPGTEVKQDAEIVILEDSPYVSRGGLKLEGALNYFHIEVKDSTVIDVGASTGGFTDCLLKKGANKVFAVDVGKGLLDWRLRNDKKVAALEGRNIRYLEFKDIGEKVDIAVIDVSFISLEKVIPKTREFLKEKGKILALIKPQFEAKKTEVGEKGIIRNPAIHKMVVDRIRVFCLEAGFVVKGVCESAIKGAKGNSEFWICLEA